MTVTPFPGFCDYSQAHGKEETLRELAIQQYTVEHILQIIRDLDVEGYVDLIPNEHVDLLFTEGEFIAAKADYEAVQAAGVDLSRVKWLSREQVKSVSPFYDLPSSIHYNNMIETWRRLPRDLLSRKQPMAAQIRQRPLRPS